MFFNADVFDIIYKSTFPENFDVVKFKKYYIQKNQFNIKAINNIYLKEKNDELIMHQPDLGIYPISNNGKFKHNDYIIWDKCIKTEIYKNSINKLGKDLYKKISWNEDIIIIYIIFNIAKSFKYIDKYGIIHIISNSSASFTQAQNDKIFCDIFYLSVIFKFTNDNTAQAKLIMI